MINILYFFIVCLVPFMAVYNNLNKFEKNRKLLFSIVLVLLGWISGYLINKIVIFIVDKTNIISDSARLIVLFIPFLIYVIVLYFILPILAKRINKRKIKLRH